MSKKSEFIRGKPKNKTGFTFSIIHKIIPIFLILICMIIATQKCARDINYDIKIIGKPFVIIKGEPFYPPWAILIAWAVAGSKANFTVGDIIYEDLKIVAGGVFVAIIIYFVLVYVRNAMNKEDKNQMNSGRWANVKDLKNVGLTAEKGVIIGQRYEAVIDVTNENGLKLDIKKIAPLVAYCTNVSGMLMAASRQGKGIGTVICTHLMYPTSILSMDPKGENFEITSGWRSKFSLIYKFAPAKKNTLFYNLLDDISEDGPYRDANLIASILTEPENPASNADPHWQNLAQVLICTTILHCKCSSYEDKSLPGVYHYLTGEKYVGKNVKGDKRRLLLKEMMDERHCRKDIDQIVRAGASQIDNAADEELGSIFSSALEALRVFNDPNVAKTCSSSDFSIMDFKYSPIPISLYMCIDFPDIPLLKSLVRAIIEFICNKFSQEGTKVGNEALKNRMLIILDEFTSLGKLECIETFAGILNGYGISFLWIVQSKAQIDKLYGQNAPIFEHCKYMWTYAINDHNIAEYFSKRIGNEGFIKQNTSNSGNRFDFGMNNMSVSQDITERPLMTPTELENLRGDMQLVFTQGAPTYLAKKVAYYSDPRFKDKANLKHPETRKELLKETVTSCVLREGDTKWWEIYENSKDDYELSFESDISDDIENSDITESNEKEDCYSTAIV